MKPFQPTNPSIQEMFPPSQHRLQQYEPTQQPAPSFLNEQFLLSAAALAASHSYPPPSSYLSSLAASNLLSSIDAHFHSINPSVTNYFDERKDYQDQHLLPNDVKNLIESSLTAIGLDNVDENDFIKAATNERNSNDLTVDDDIENFERSTTSSSSGTNNITTTKQITRPVNIPNSFGNDYFANNQLFDETLGSVCCCFFLSKPNLLSFSLSLAN